VAFLFDCISFKMSEKEYWELFGMESSLTNPNLMVTSREDVDLKERDEILASLKAIAEYNYQHAGNKIAQDQTIIVLGGACGIGKTRLGHEFFKKMKKK